MVISGAVDVDAIVGKSWLFWITPDTEGVWEAGRAVESEESAECENRVEEVAIAEEVAVAALEGPLEDEL